MRDSNAVVENPATGLGVRGTRDRHCPTPPGRPRNGSRRQGQPDELVGESPQPNESRLPRYCRLMPATPSARSPLINDAFQLRGSASVREATYFGRLFVRSAKPVSSPAVGQ